MEVTYQLSRTDISQLFRYIRHHRSMMRPVFQVGFLFIFGLIVLAGFISVQGARNTPKMSITDFFWTLGIAALLLYQVYTLIIRPFVVEWQAQRDAQMVSRKTISISPDAALIHDSFGDVALSWPLVTAIVDDRDCFYLFLEKNDAHAIPKRAFDSSAEAYAFFDLASDYWQKAKGIVTPPALDTSGVWPPAPRAGDSQELGGTPKR